MVPVQNTDLGDIAKLRQKLTRVNLPGELAEHLHQQLNRLEKISSQIGYQVAFEQEVKYIEFVSSLPFASSSPDILDLKRAREILNQNHYGLDLVKERILEYLSILILNHRLGVKTSRAQVLAFVGLVGSGKTSLAYSIAESLGRKLIRIPFGGFGSVKELRGGSRADFEAEAGLIMKGLQRAGCNNPVILLDEIDRVSIESRADMMGVLVELLDPEQNFSFVDRYIDYPFDLSNVLFLATANNVGNIATAVLDRLEIVEMPSYTDEEKVVIARNYLLPKAVKEAGLNSDIIKVDEDIWPQIVRPLGYDGGIRSLQRHIQAIVRKVAKQVVEGTPGPYQIKVDNIGKYLG